MAARLRFVLAPGRGGCLRRLRRGGGPTGLRRAVDSPFGAPLVVAEVFRRTGVPPKGQDRIDPLPIGWRAGFWARPSGSRPCGPAGRPAFDAVANWALEPLQSRARRAGDASLLPADCSRAGGHAIARRCDICRTTLGHRGGGSGNPGSAHAASRAARPTGDRLRHDDGGHRVAAGARGGHLALARPPAIGDRRRRSRRGSPGTRPDRFPGRRSGGGAGCCSARPRAAGRGHLGLAALHLGRHDARADERVEPAARHPGGDDPRRADHARSGTARARASGARWSHRARGLLSLHRDRLDRARVARPLGPEQSRWLDAIDAASRSALQPEPDAAIRAALYQGGTSSTPGSRPELWRNDPKEVLSADIAGYLHVQKAEAPERIYELALAEPERTLRAETLRALEVRRPDVRPLLQWFDSRRAFSTTVVLDEDGPLGFILMPRGNRSAPMTLEEARAVRLLADRISALLAVSSALRARASGSSPRSPAPIKWTTSASARAHHPPRVGTP